MFFQLLREGGMVMNYIEMNKISNIGCKMIIPNYIGQIVIFM